MLGKYDVALVVCLCVIIIIKKYFQSLDEYKLGFFKRNLYTYLMGLNYLRFSDSQTWLLLFF